MCGKDAVISRSAYGIASTMEIEDEWVELGVGRGRFGVAFWSIEEELNVALAG